MQLTENEIASLMGTTETNTATLPMFSETNEFDSASLDFAICEIAKNETSLPIVLRVVCPRCSAAIGQACVGATHQTRKVLAGRVALKPVR